MNGKEVMSVRKGISRLQMGGRCSYIQTSETRASSVWLRRVTAELRRCVAGHDVLGRLAWTLRIPQLGSPQPWG
jgi:hypothetical protein